jgi:hypothetical protein
MGEIAVELQQEYQRACAELVELYPDEDVTRVDEVWNVRWHEWREVLGVGSSRVAVGLCLEHVLKVEMNEGLQNDGEWAVWQKADAELRQWLCPVLAHDKEKGNWLLMARCQKVARLEEETMAIADRVQGIWDLEGADGGGFEWMLDNWGQLEGRQVILDYGYSDVTEVGLSPGGRAIAGAE